MARRRIYILCCFALILILGSYPLSSVQATSPFNNPFLVFSYGQAAGATYPALAYNPQNHEYLLVWCKQLGGHVAIFAMRISNNGVLSESYPVSETSADIVRCKPDIAYNSTSHNYLIVWEEELTGLQFNVHGRLFSPGSLLGPEITFNDSGSSNYVYPSVAYSSTSNEFLVVWAVQPFQGNYSILAQRFSETLGKQGGNYTVVQGHDTINNYDPDVAYNPARNEYLVVWTRQDTAAEGGPNRDIFGRILTYNLTPLHNELLVAYTSLQEYAPSVAAIQTPTPESGRYLVAWERLWPDSGDHDIFGSLVMGESTLIDIGAISASSLDERAPAVTGNMNDNLFMVSWNSTYLPPYQLNIGVRACNVSLSGNVVDKAWAGGIKSGMSATASGPGDQFIVIFEDTTFFLNADLFGRFWGDLLYLPMIKK